MESIRIFDADVPIKSSILSLGLTIDSCLTWNKHVDVITGKCIGLLIRLSRLRHIIPTNTIVLLINALILPHVRFCISVWGNCNLTQVKRIDKIIKFAKRIVGRAGVSVKWHGDVRMEYNIAAVKIVRQCLLFPECVPSSISSLSA